MALRINLSAQSKVIVITEPGWCAIENLNCRGCSFKFLSIILEKCFMRICQKLHKISKIQCIKMCKFVVVLFYFISIRGSRMAQLLFRFSFAPRVFFRVQWF